MTATEVHQDDRTHRNIVIVINNTEFTAPDDEMTGRELLSLAGLPDTNHLFLDVPGPGEDRPIGLDEKVKLRRKMRFYDVPVGNFG